MRIVSIHSKNKLFANDVSKIEPEIADSEESMAEEPSQSVDINSIPMYYINPETGERLPNNQPSEVEASDGTKLIGGVIKIDNPKLLTDEGLVEQILNKVILFINSNSKTYVTRDNLITDKLDRGIVSFIISPLHSQAKGSKTIITAVNKANDVNVDKEVKKFFEKFPLTDDPSDFNIPKANQEIHDLLEKVAVNLSKAEKNRIRVKIKKQLAQHNIKLTYLET